MGRLILQFRDLLSEIVDSFLQVRYLISQVIVICFESIV